MFAFFFVCYLLLRNTRYRCYLSQLILPTYLGVTGVLVNLALRDRMPFGLQADMENLDFFQGVLMFTYVLINIPQVNSFLFFTMINGPLYLVLTYFEQLRYLEIEMENTGTINDTILSLRMNRAVSVVLAITMGQYFM
jgi:hypothetical protein